MNRSIAFCFALIVGGPSPAGGQQRLHASFAVGIDAVTDSHGQLGPFSAVGIEHGFGSGTLRATVSVTLHSLEDNVTTGDLLIAGLEVLDAIPLRAVRHSSYLIVGPGAALIRRHRGIEVFPAPQDDHSTTFSFSAGLGASRRMGAFDVQLEARYIWLSATGLTRAHMVPIGVRVVF